MRQIHLWTAGLVIASAWLGATLDRRSEPADQSLFDVRLLIPDNMRAFAWLIMLGVLAILPAWAMMAVFYFTWGGHLVPPSFVTWHDSGRLQLGTPAFLLTLFGLLSVAYLPFLLPALRVLVRDRRPLLCGAVVAGVLLGLIGPTSTSLVEGRFGAIWSVSARFPVVADRSLAIVAGAVVGSVALVAWLLGMPARARWIMLAALSGFAAAQSANPQLWQRYHEPFVLLWIVLAVGILSQSKGVPTRSRWLAIGPAALTIVLLIGACAGVYGEPVVIDDGNRLGHILPPPGVPVDRPGAN